MANHTSYELSKALKEFLGDSAPEPMDGIYCYGKDKLLDKADWSKLPSKCIPAYTLDDILSKPFCEAMAKAIRKNQAKNFKPSPMDVQNLGIELRYILSKEYYAGGFPAVELALKRLIGR
jgi:hypothetical protein